MKHLIFAGALMEILLFAGEASAAISVSNFQITTTTVSFNISGTLSGPLPLQSARTLFFVNTVPASPGFVLTPFVSSSSSQIWTGSQILDSSYPLFTGSPSFSTGDYFGMAFASNLSVGEIVSGSVFATFASGTFDPTAVSAIELVWGTSGDGSSFSGGSSQTTFAVPEPSSSMLFGLFGLGLATRRRRS